MTTLIDRFATDRLRGATLVLAYGAGIALGTIVAAAALLVAISG